MFIPAGKILLTQSRDVVINKPFKGLVKDYTEIVRIPMDDAASREINTENCSFSQNRIKTANAVEQAWEFWTKKSVTK